CGAAFEDTHHQGRHETEGDRLDDSKRAGEQGAYREKDPAEENGAVQGGDDVEGSVRAGDGFGREVDAIKADNLKRDKVGSSVERAGEQPKDNEAAAERGPAWPRLADQVGKAGDRGPESDVSR